jgi:hypothetical protein
VNTGQRKKPVAKSPTKKPTTKKSKSKHRASNKKISPEIIENARQMYVRGVAGSDGVLTYPSIETVARSHKVSPMTIARRSNDGDWPAQRKQFVEELRVDLDIQRRKEIVDQAVAFDSTSLNLAKGLYNEITALLRSAVNDRAKAENILAEQAAWDANNPNDRRPVIKPDYKPFTPFALGSLATALSTAQRVGRLAVGESTENTSVKHSSVPAEEVAAARGFIDEVIRQRQSSGKGSVGKLH